MIMIFIATKKNHQQRIVGQCDKDQLQIILALDEGRHVVVVKAFVIITRGGRRRVVQEPGQTDLVLVEFRGNRWWQGIVMIQAIVANGHVGQGMIGGEGLGKGLGDGRLQCRWFFHSLAGGCRGGGVLAGGSGMLEDLQFLQGARRGRLQSLDHLNGFAMNRGGSGPRNPQLQVRQARVDGQHSGHGGATRRPLVVELERYLLQAGVVRLEECRHSVPGGLAQAHRRQVQFLQFATLLLFLLRDQCQC